MTIQPCADLLARDVTRLGRFRDDNKGSRFCGIRLRTRSAQRDDVWCGTLHADAMGLCCMGLEASYGGIL